MRLFRDIQLYELAEQKIKFVSRIIRRETIRGTLNLGFLLFLLLYTRFETDLTRSRSLRAGQEFEFQRNEGLFKF